MSSKAAKDAAVKQFRAITNATAADATRLMKASSYRLEAAVEAFYRDSTAMDNAAAASTSSSSAADRDARKNLNALFDKYKDAGVASGNEMNIEGTMEYCSDLGISPEDVVLLALSFYLQSPTMGKFTRDGFLSGWKTLADGGKALDTIDKQKEHLPALADQLKRDAPVKGDLGKKAKGGLFKKVYEYTYAFARPEGQKSLPLDTALAFWDLLMPHSPSFETAGGEAGTFTQRQLDMWKEFLVETTNGRAVPKDTWSLFLDFTYDVDPDFQAHDFDAAWPSLIDGFVTWAQEKPKDYQPRAVGGDDAEGMDQS